MTTQQRIIVDAAHAERLAEVLLIAADGIRHGCATVREESTFLARLQDLDGGGRLLVLTGTLILDCGKV